MVWKMPKESAERSGVCSRSGKSPTKLREGVLEAILELFAGEGAKLLKTSPEWL
jgi:hypothetical protein